MSANDNALCSSCGLCCNGWMFSVSTPAADEVAHFRALVGLVNDCVPQPCVFHDGTSCRIYDARPAGCRHFRCDTLEGLITGSFDLDAARARLGLAQTAVDAVTREMRVAGWLAAGEAPASGWQRLLAALPVMSIDDRRRNRRLLIEAVACAHALKAFAGNIGMG